ncbi:hypothetical protein RXV95_15795 [Novosphingobium sp. ZN18A2]|uniref:hypothetical protein n=1 Tax=Novosphingobium sp. ZN18A2 TaxID=3079861 RepID=UPI0030D08D7E
MGLLNWAAAGIAGGYAIYRIANRSRRRHAALPGRNGFGGNFSKVRDAGADAQRDRPVQWDKVDEAMDETFPASDPPASY